MAPDTKEAGAAAKAAAPKAEAPKAETSKAGAAAEKAEECGGCG